MLLPAAFRRKFRIGRPRRFAYQVNHALPFLISRTSDDDPVVFAATGVTAIRGTRLAQNFLVTHRVPFATIYGEVQDRWSHHRTLRFKHARFDELPLPGTLLVFKRGQDAKSHSNGAHSVRPGNFTARFHRRVRIAPESHDSGVGEQLPTPSHPGFERSGQSPARHHDLHDARVDLLQRFKTETEPLQNTRAEIVYDHVGGRHMLLEKLFAFGMA